MKRIPIPIYGGELVVTASKAEFNAAWNRMLAAHSVDDGSEVPRKSPAPGGMTSSAVTDSGLVIVSGVFQRNASVRCHEATHCAQAVAEAAGMHPLREQEAFAYLTQWFFDRLGGA